MDESVLLELASLATRTDQPGEALERIVRIMAHALRADRASLALLNPDSDRLEIEVRHNLPAGYEDPLPPGQSFPGRAFFHGKPLRAGGEMAVPLFSNEGLAIGALWLERTAEPVFAEEDLGRLVRLTEEAGRVMHQIWQFDHLRNKGRQLETLLSAGQSLVSKLEEGALFSALTRDAQRLMQSQACALYLFDPADQTVRFGGASGLERPAPGSWPLDSSFVAAPIRTGKPVTYSNIQSPEYYDLADLPRDPQLRSALAIPLAYEGEVLGVLAVFLDRPRRFDNDEKRLCQALASLGAVALQNARLYSRVFQSEEALRKNERLTMLGLISAEVAHEIRNPLTVLKLLHGGLGVDFPEGDPRRTDLRIIGEKLDQLESIAARVLNFSRASSRLHAPCALGEIVEDTLVLVRLKLDQAKIQLRYEPANRPAIVNGHKGELQQVLLNLIINAIDAMPQGGEMHLVARVEPGATGPAAVLTLTDTGPGVPEGLRARLFDAFLSGRPEGTGLGLTIAKRLLASHNGDVVLAETGPSGTTFRITLPLV